MDSRISAIELLTGEIDVNQGRLWSVLKSALIQSEPFRMDRASSSNINKLLAYIAENPQLLEYANLLLRIVPRQQFTIFNEYIVAIINTVVLSRTQIDIIASRDFLKTLTSISANDEVVKMALFEDTIDSFIEFVQSVVDTKASIASGIFELYLTLLSNCQYNRGILKSKDIVNHLRQCFTLIRTSKDSLTQLLVTEWIWRLRDLVSEEVLSNIFGGFYNAFCNITRSAFRSSLHQFIRVISDSSKCPDSSRIFHAPFRSIKIGKTRLDCSGWADLNPDTLGLVLLEKNVNANLNDVFILRLSEITSFNIKKAVLELKTTEVVRGFGVVGEPEPSKFTVYLEDYPTGFEQALRRRCSQPMVTPMTTKSLNTNRIYATKQVTTTEDTKIKRKSITQADTQERDRSLKEIERMVNEFQQKSILSLDQMGERFAAEVNDIINRLAERERALEQLSEQHKRNTEFATVENKQIAEKVSSLLRDFQSRHTDIVERRTASFDSVVNELNQEKQRFRDDTQSVFANNALVGLSQALTTLNDRISAISVAN